MKIGESFPGLEHEISCLLNQIKKQEPISVASCKQISDGLQKLKEYQSTINQKEKMPVMEVKIDQLVQSFHQTADNSKQQLQGILALISEGKAPDIPVMDQMNATVAKLREQYANVCQAAADKIPEAEMPPDGSSADAYVEAVKNSKFLEYRKQLDAMRTTLAQFISVQSLAETYAAALAPYQDEARSLMEQMHQTASIDQNSVTEFKEKTAGPDAFLAALDCPDFDTDENLEILGNAAKYYPLKIQVGLSGQRYYLPEKAAIDFPDHAESIEIVSPAAESPLKAKEDAASDIQSTPADNEDTISDVQSTTADDSETDRWHTLGIDAPQDFLYTISNDQLTVEKSPKAQTEFFAKKFENEIKSHGYFPDNAYALVTAFKMNCMSPSMLLALSGRQGSFTAACELLLKFGYLQKYTVPGYPYFHTLTDRGIKIFTTQKSAQLLDSKKVSAVGGTRIRDTAAAALARVLLVSAFELSVRIAGTELTANERVFTNSFYLQTVYPEKKLRLGFAGLVGTSIASFEEFAKELFYGNDPKAFEGNAAFIVLGLNKSHAFKMAEFLDHNIHEALSETVLCCFDYETKTCYRYSDGSVVEPSAFAAGVSGSTPDSPSSEAVVPETIAAADVSKPQVGQTDPAAETDPLSQESLSAAQELSAAEKAAVTDSVLAAEPSTEPSSKKSEPAAEKETEEEEAQKVQTDPQREEHMCALQEMLKNKQFYCACAYLRALAEKYPLYKSFCEQLAYALNDPAARCSYTSSQILTTYFYNSTEEDSDSLVLAASLRNFFYDQSIYDPQIPTLYASLLSNPLLELYPELKSILYSFKDFKTHQHHGYDRYADYRQKDRQKFEEEKKLICSKAQEAYQTHVVDDIHEKSPNERFLNTLKLLFKTSSYSLLPEALAFTARGDADSDTFEMICLDLQEKYIKDGCTICCENIDLQKLDHEIDLAWDHAGKEMKLIKKTDKLTGNLKTKLHNRLFTCVSVLADYAHLLQDKPAENEQALIEARRCRSDLLQSLDAALKCCSLMDDAVAAAVLCFTLTELHDRITGRYTEGDNLYFYQDFLRGDLVLLNENTWLPILDEVPFVEDFSILKRIVEHSRQNLPSFEQKLQHILSTDDTLPGKDDYGSGSLILQLLERTHPDLDLSQFNLKASLPYATNQISENRKHAVEDLELAQSDGQITDDSQKEAYIAVISDWYARALADRNYGFFRKILHVIDTSIKKDAAYRKGELEQDLAAYLAENPDWKNSPEIRNAVERFNNRLAKQNYAAAEDQLNCLKSNDLSTGIELPGTDHLQQFMSDYNIYLNEAKHHLSYLQMKYHNLNNKEGRGAARLADNWPQGGTVKTDSLRIFLETLGFCIDRLKPQSSIDNAFVIHLKHSVDGKPIHYTHPIYIFGSQAETSGFQVVVLFGRHDASTLMDKFETFGSTYNTIVLLDHQLSLPDRRLLARLTKKKGTAGKTFAVIDRVVLSYLTAHYSETSISRTLMSVIMPFAANQPYVPESSRIMPQEIFMGRRNELEKIKSPNGPNLVYGGRQLGKSALLRMAQKDIDHDQNGDRAVLVDIKGKTYAAAAEKISRELCSEGILTSADITADWDKLSLSIRSRLRSDKDRIPYLLLLLDEADVFLESCEEVNYSPFDALKDIQLVGAERFKFVVAGHHNVVRINQRATLGNNSSLPHMSSLSVRPFKASEARDLLEVPLWYLGFRFENNEDTDMLISNIFNTTNYFPGMLQLYCSKLIEAMQMDYAGYDENDTPPYRVSRDHIKKALADDTLRNQIREKFEITLHVDQDNYYYLIALLGAFHYHDFQRRSFTAQDIRQYACDYEISKLSALPVSSIKALMEEMRELNVLQTVTADSYRFTRENFRMIMGSRSEVEEKIFELWEDSSNG